MQQCLVMLHLPCSPSAGPEQAQSAAQEDQTLLACTVIRHCLAMHHSPCKPSAVSEEAIGCPGAPDAAGLQHESVSV